jgi:hypothetical protein
MIVLAYLNKFDKKIGSAWTPDSSAGREPRLSHDLKIKQGVASRGLQSRAQVEEGQDLHRSTGPRSTGERDRAAQLQHREGAGPHDCNTGREQDDAIAATDREATGETAPPLKLEAEGARRHALYEKKGEYDKEAARDRAATGREAARDRAAADDESRRRRERGGGGAYLFRMCGA